MANKELISLIRSGPDIWNSRRILYPQSYWNLSEYDFSDIELSGADLSGVDLNRSNLSNKSFFNMNLSGANLYNAHLHGTNLSRANLEKATLIGTNLILANLSSAQLSEADFTRAMIGWTIFSANDLRLVKGLDTVIHSGPSEIAISTIYESQGNIPEVFLRGAGVPDNFITYMSSLTSKAFDFYTCFISYSSKDQKFVRRLYIDLQSKGVRCWYAPEDLKIGERIRIEIDESIRRHDKLLLVLSRNSVASDWVEKEVETAMERERVEKRTVLFPIRLDDTVMMINSGWPADIRRTRHIGDFQRWKEHDTYQRSFNRLMRDLKADGSKSSRA